MTKIHVFIIIVYLVKKIVDLLTLPFYLPCKWIIRCTKERRIVSWRLITALWELYPEAIDGGIYAIYLIPDKNYITTLVRLLLLRQQFTICLTMEEYVRSNKHVIEHKHIAKISNYLKGKYKYESIGDYILE